MNTLAKVTLLLSACLCLNSCYSKFYRCASERARIIEDALWAAPGHEIYQVGDKWYIPGRRGPLRGAQKGLPVYLFGLHGGEGPSFHPIEGEGEIVYIPIGSTADGAPWSFRASLKGKQHRIRFMDQAEQHLLTELPAHARKKTLDFPLVTSNDTHQFVSLQEHSDWVDTAPNARALSLPQTDTAHALYAWPLAAVTAAAVDLPCTVVGNALLLTGAAAVAPVCLTGQQVQMAFKPRHESRELSKEKPVIHPTEEQETSEKATP